MNNCNNFGVITIIASDEEDILTCKPQWEVSQLNLPKFNSEEDGAEHIGENNLQIVAEKKKYADERSEKRGSAQNDVALDDRCKHKRATSQKVALTYSQV